MKPIDPDAVFPLDSFARVRWLGPDGGWRSGIAIVGGRSVTVLDQHRGEVAELSRNEFEYDTPRDDEGNPKDQQ